MDGTGRLFTAFAAALGGEFKVKVVTYPTVEPLGYVELESVARRALPTEGPYVLLGESFSGPIAVALAASGSSQLKGLILCCSFARNPRPAFANLGALVRVLPVTHAPVALLSHLLLGQFSTKALRQSLSQALAEVTPSALKVRLRAVLAVNVSAKLSTIKVPILYLRASRDRLVPSAASALVSQLNPCTKVVELEAPHFLLQAAPAEAAQAIGAFVREIQSKLHPSQVPNTSTKELPT